MTDPTPGRRATYADLEALPEGVKGEIIDGVLYTAPRPGPPHIFAASTLGGILLAAFQRGQGGPGGWWILQEPELRLPGETALQPDIAGWRKERLTPSPQLTVFDVAPNWVCEVLSPDRRSRRVDRNIKPPAYHRAGVKHRWELDPLARELQVFRAEPAGWVLLGVFIDDDRIRAEPFAELEIDLLEIWGQERTKE